MSSYMNGKSYTNRDTLTYLPLKTKKSATNVDRLQVLIKLYTIIVIQVYQSYLALFSAQFAFDCCLT